VTSARWLPIALRWYYLCAVIATSAALEIVCIALIVASHKNNGLAEKQNTNAFSFSWRFMPTIVAVLYALIWIPIRKDVIRTEPWALMSMPGGSKASESLLRDEAVWWTEITHALRARTNVGGIRWAVILAITGSLTSAIFLNSLSAGFFDIDDVSLVTKQPFATIAPPLLSAPYPHITDITYFKAITPLIYNISTSAWAKPGYAVAPFWPSELQKAPLAARVDMSSQIWEGTSDVFSVQLDCKQLTPIIAGYRTDVWDNSSYPVINLVSDDGCALEVPDAGGGTRALGSWNQFDVSYASNYV
jgi:hypothetical protein